MRTGAEKDLISKLIKLKPKSKAAQEASREGYEKCELEICKGELKRIGEAELTGVAFFFLKRKAKGLKSMIRWLTKAW